MGIKSIAIITARGGSKRIPKKNIRDFNGKPIIAYSIEAALEAGIFDEVMVSTDSEEIAEIARKYGANVPFFRSAKNSSDTATTRDVILEVLNKYIELGNEPEYACCIYPTAPFITSEKLCDGKKLLERKGVYMVNPVVKFSFPPQRGLIIDENDIIQLKWIENRDIRSQDLEPIYHDCGQFYWYNVKEYIKRDGIMDGFSAPLVIDDIYVQDIDSESDWEIAEMKYRILKEKNML